MRIAIVLPNALWSSTLPVQQSRNRFPFRTAPIALLCALLPASFNQQEATDESPRCILQAPMIAGTRLPRVELSRKASSSSQAMLSCSFKLSPKASRCSSSSAALSQATCSRARISQTELRMGAGGVESAHVVVVGAGVGGLASAARLRKAGCR